MPNQLANESSPYLLQHANASRQRRLEIEPPLNPRDESRNYRHSRLEMFGGNI